MSAAGFTRLGVVRVDRLCADATAITLCVPDALRAEFAFYAGQSIVVRRPATTTGAGWIGERRSYSICAAEGEPLRIGVREVDGGALSPWLVHGVVADDVLEVARPAGGFTADLTQGSRHVMIAAGSGITPVLSLASTALRLPGSAVTLVYGNRRSDTVMFAEELSDLKDAHPQALRLLHVLSREPRGADVLSGRIDAAHLERLLADELPGAEESHGGVAHWWLCGPLAMVSDVRELLRGHGVPADRIHRELFYVEDAPPPAATHAEPVPSGRTASVTIVLDGRRTTLALDVGTPILDGAQRVRADLPFACKGGVCGTCRARVTEGEVRMRRNFALEDAELAAGYALTCQAIPVSAAVTVDYDS